jgi:prepilin-type processing-associated H-X9-DG protein
MNPSTRPHLDKNQRFGATGASPHGSRVGAFTIVELLVVLAVLVLGAMLLVPALARTQLDSRATRCLNNHRQLCRAWQMYADDNNERIVGNYQGGDAQGGAAANDPKKAPWALGWLDWGTSPDNTNVLFLIDDKFAKLGRYFGKDKMILKCPADVYISPVQQNRGWTARVRSISANIGVGEGNAEVGPWDPLYKHIRKTTDFIYPGPAETLVYLDEHPCSINDPGFYSPHATSWIDQPASYHDGAAGCGFADGHVEMHKWQGSLSTPAAGRVSTSFTGVTATGVAANDPDIHWMSYRAGRVSNVSY